MSVIIVGVGMRDTKSLTAQAKERIEGADIIIGAKRVAAPFESVGKRMIYEYEAEKIARIIEENPSKNTAVLFSGDASFYSGAKRLIEFFPDAEIIPGISCVSYFCAKIGLSYDDMNIISAHGRACNIVSEVRGHKKTFLLLGENPCEKLCRYGLSDTEVYIGENLSYNDERILRGRAGNFRDTKTGALSVMVIVNENYDNRVRIGISDAEFIRGANALSRVTPMTKAAVRAVSVSRLEIKPTDICYDIGAGTGSVSVEAALLCPRGKVYAVEKDAEAAELIEKNAVKFMTDNIEVVCGEAPDALSGLPRADKVFIGGSSGSIAEIIRKCDCARAVVNAVTLETLTGTLKAFEEQGYAYEVTLLSAANAEKAGNYSLMKADNPIFVILGVKE